MEKKRETYINPHVKALTNLDMTVQDSAIVRLKSPYNLDLETTNKLLNPMEWQRAMDNSLIPVKKTGLQVAVVTNIAPLYLVISLVSSTTNELGARYVISVERQAAANPGQAPSDAAFCFSGRQGERRLCAAGSQRSAGKSRCADAEAGGHR